jgi:hypothetical protein
MKMERKGGRKKKETSAKNTYKERMQTLLRYEWIGSDGNVYKKTGKEQKRQIHNAICCWILNSLSALHMTLPSRSIRRTLTGCRALTCTRHFITLCYRKGINPTAVLLST